MEAERLIGVYRPTANKGIVHEQYQKLGFAPSGPPEYDGRTEWVLALDSRTELPTAIASEEAGW